MLIFLFFGLLGIGLGARWYKRRYDQKQQQKMAALSGMRDNGNMDIDREAALSPEMRGASPHQDARGYQHNSNGILPIINEDRDSRNSKEKSKRSSHVAVTEIQPASTPVHTKEPKN